MYLSDRHPPLEPYEVEREMLRAAGFDLALDDCQTPQEVIERAADAAALWITWRGVVTPEVMAALPSVRGRALGRRRTGPHRQWPGMASSRHRPARARVRSGPLGGGDPSRAAEPASFEEVLASADYVSGWSLPQMLLRPRAAGYSRESWNDLRREMCDNANSFLQTGWAEAIVNLEVRAHLRQSPVAAAR